MRFDAGSRVDDLFSRRQALRNMMSQLAISIFNVRDFLSGVFCSDNEVSLEHLHDTWIELSYMLSLSLTVEASIRTFFPSTPPSLLLRECSPSTEPPVTVSCDFMEETSGTERISAVILISPRLVVTSVPSAAGSHTLKPYLFTLRITRRAGTVSREVNFFRLNRLVLPSVILGECRLTLRFKVFHRFNSGCCFTLASLRHACSTHASWLSALFLCH